jgi:hypothetical protein
VVMAAADPSSSAPTTDTPANDMDGPAINALMM